MEQLWITLPALSPDYSGVCSALFDLGGMSVIHDASGCTGNYTGYDEPRWFGARSMVFCSGLREIDAVLGRDDKLIDHILKASEYTNPTLYAVIGSPVPMVIGSDMKGIAREIENSTGKPAFGFSTNGIGLYNKGVSDAMLAVIRRFLAPTDGKTDHGINVIGTTPLDFSANSNAEDLYRALEQAGFRIIGKLMMGADLGQIRDLTKAEVNLVVTESGLDTAKYLWENYGIPYVAGTIAGLDTSVFGMIEETRKDRKCRVLGRDADGGSHPAVSADADSAKGMETDAAENNGSGGVLIIGEEILGNSIRHAIHAVHPEIPVTVATMTGLRKELAQEGDLDLNSEAKLIAALESGRFRMLVGDPLLGDVKPEDLPLVPIPHTALSSKLYWSRAVHFIGGEMDDIVKKITDLWRIR
ncbi:nitrogenase component 1 [[Clostridium] aminophilum]|uniref:nitrogenase component 1 n=1 Tax=[Clostridium] aminophilum TaxID=1526 RepID=UPI003321C79D